MRETFISGSILPAIQPAFQKNVRSFHGVISYFCASLEKFCAVVGEGMSVEGQGRIVWYNTGQRRCRWVDMCAPWGRRQQRGSSHFLGELLQGFPGTVPPGLTSLPTELAGSLPIFEQGCSVRCIELPNMGLGFRFQSFGERKRGCSLSWDAMKPPGSAGFSATKHEMCSESIKDFKRINENNGKNSEGKCSMTGILMFKGNLIFLKIVLGSSALFFPRFCTIWIALNIYACLWCW